MEFYGDAHMFCVAFPQIKLFNGSFVAVLTKFLSVYLENELLCKRGAMTANSIIDIKDQLHKHFG